MVGKRFLSIKRLKIVSELQVDMIGKMFSKHANYLKYPNMRNVHCGFGIA